MSRVRLIDPGEPGSEVDPALADLVAVRSGGPVPAPGVRWMAVIETRDVPLALAELADAIERGASAVSVLDVAAATDFLAVHDALAGRRAVDPALALPDALRREPPPAPGS